MEDRETISELLEKERLIRKSRELLLRTRVLRSHLSEMKIRIEQQNQRLIQESSNQKISNGEIITTDVFVPDDEVISEQRTLIKSKQDAIQQCRAQINKHKGQVLERSKVLAKDFCSIYTIIEFPNKGGYSICDIHLPDSDNFEGHDETMVSVALGYVTQLLQVLCDLLDVTLLFPLKYLGSKSLIYCNQRNQYFPLFIESFKSNKECTNLQNGVGLLNLNIVELRALHGLPTKESKDTLGNLLDFQKIFADETLKID